MEERGILDQFTESAFVVIIIIMNKDPNAFKSLSFPNGQGQSISAIEMTWNLAVKGFELANTKEDEIEAICAVTLLNGMLENISNLQGILPAIIDKYLSELSKADTSDYKIMLVQGIMMCLWYDYGVSLTKFEEINATSSIFQVIFEQVPTIKQDFEVKRFVLGLSSLIVNSDMPQAVKDNYGNLIKALVFLS